MLSQFTQTMRATESDSELFEECPGRETFDQMLSNAIAHEMSKSGRDGPEQADLPRHGRDL